SVWRGCTSCASKLEKSSSSTPFLRSTFSPQATSFALFSQLTVFMNDLRPEISQLLLPHRMGPLSVSRAEVLLMPAVPENFLREPVWVSSESVPPGGA